MTTTLAATEAPVAPTGIVTTTHLRFTSMDRCDTCGAQAYIGATVNGTELIFCAHHGRKYEAKLRAVATTWHDETARLLEEGANRHKE